MKKCLGRYELREAIRPGAVGTVWEAWDATLARRVAIEIVPLRSGEIGKRELIARFQQEAEVVGKVARTGLVQVHDFGEEADETYIVREFVEGESLGQLSDRIGPIPVSRAAAIMLGVFETLEACHRLGIVHREIRPSNILLAGVDRVKLTGFGVAPIGSGEATLTGTAWTTSPYTSPEQVTEQSPADARSDIWSCGAVLYEMLTGRPPFRSSDAATTGQAIVHDDPEPPSSLRPDLPAALEAAILRALRKAPAERFASVVAFADALKAATAVAPLPTPPAVRRPFPLRAALLSVGAVVVVAGGLAFWIGSKREVPKPDTSPSVAGPPPAAPPAVPPAAPPSLAQRLLEIPCSTVSVTEAAAGSAASVRGIIGSGASRNALDAILAERQVNVEIREFPPSPISCRMAEIVRAHAGPKPGGLLLLAGGDAPLRPGDDILLKLRAPAFDGEVRLEDLDGDGQVQHVMEANLGTVPRFAAGATIGLGRNGDDLIGRATDGSSTEILVAIMTASPLFAQARAVTEPGAAYLDALEPALDALRQRGGAVAMDAAVLTIMRRAN